MPACNSLAFPSFFFSFPPCSPPHPTPNIFSKTANSRLLLGKHGVIHIFEVMVQLWGTDQYLDPRRFSVSELHTHNPWCLYSKYDPYQSATVWNVTVLGEKKRKESWQVGSGLELQGSAFISTMQPAAFAFIAGGAVVVAIAVKLKAVPETWGAESQQNWPFSLRTYLDIFFGFFFPALPLVLIPLSCSSLLLKTLIRSHCKPHPNPSFFLLFLPSPLSLLFSFLHRFYIRSLSSLHLQ